MVRIIITILILFLFVANLIAWVELPDTNILAQNAPFSMIMLAVIGLITIGTRNRSAL